MVSVEVIKVPYVELSNRHSLQVTLLLLVGASMVHALQSYRHSKEHNPAKLPTDWRRFRNFQVQYLSVYLLASFADWLQGPFVYALYASYGVSSRSNALLFMCGFVSSMVIGTKVASLADMHGRRRLAMLYCVAYGAACVLKHCNDLTCLLIGRVLGGVSTSLLLSVFDSWMCSEHRTRRFDDALLPSTYSMQVSLNSTVAIAAGLVAEVAAGAMPMVHVGGVIHLGGYITPFDVSACVLMLTLVLIWSLWGENHGTPARAPTAPTVRDTVFDICRSPRLLSVCLISSFYEAAMYIFVFKWSPTLIAASVGSIEFGMIFAAFMSACMFGSQLFRLLSVGRLNTLSAALVLATLAHAVVALGNLSATQIFIAFLAYEISVGLYFPSIGVVKASAVPERCRASVYSVFRLPLNVIVVLSLALDLPGNTAFILTSALLGIATILDLRASIWFTAIPKIN